MARLTIRQAFDLGLRHHQAGRLQEAEQLYRQVLAQQPKHTGAMHLLGVIAHQMGRNDVAVDLIRQAIALNPNYPEAYNNLGNALKDKGQLDEAIDAYRKAIALRPNFPDAHNNLGNALQGNRQLDEAIAAYRQAIALNPNFPEAHSNLGMVLRNKRQLDEAISACRQAIALRPNYAEAHSNLGNALKDKGQLDEAIAAYRQAIALNPHLPEAHSNLSMVLRDKGQFDEAISACRQAIALNPGVPEAYNNLGNALQGNRQLDEAIATFSKAIELRPGWAMPRVNLGQLFREQGRLEEARFAFQQAVECEPDNSDAHNCLAAVLAELQRFDEAAKALDCAVALAPDSALTHEARGMILWRSGRGAQAVHSFRRALEIEPESASAWISLGQTLRQIGRFAEVADCARQILARRPGAVQAYTLLASVGATADPTEMGRLAASLDDPQISMRDRAKLGFALGKMLDDADRFDEAFAHYARANSLVLQMRHAAGERYDSDQFAHRVDDLIATFTPDFFAHARHWGESSELPVFIVGMPRSGTSLVEQIASSHPDVFGAGELRDIDNIAAALRCTEYRPDSIKVAARKQLDRLRVLGGSALRVIDKMPHNVEHIGLIATLFPAARVILCRRDPRDTCLSCFFQRFDAGNLLYSFDLTQCGRHHVHTDRLIAHWLKVRPLRMLQVQYEDLVADLEGQSRRIISFLGLPWNPACLDFHRTERTVQTASDWQVRQPIFTRSVGRWRNYERHLGPLFEALGLTE
jgi:tetratricopeptide (TPR) repeat protein